MLFIGCVEEEVRGGWTPNASTLLKSCDFEYPIIINSNDAISELHPTQIIRAPNLVKPEDHVCQRLAPIVYAKCGPSDVDATVEEAIQSLKASLTSVGPFLSKGIILISFFEKREVKGFFGLVSSTENIYFERWRIPVLIDERQLLSPQYVDQYESYHSGTNRYPSNESDCGGRTDYYAQGAAEIERKYLVDFALQVVQKRLVTILEVIDPQSFCQSRFSIRK